MNSKHNLSTIMGKQFLLILISLLIFSSSSHAQNNSSSCPIDFNYVDTFSWDTSVCTTVAASANDTKICCTALRSLLGIGLSRYLKVTNTFYFTNLQTSTSCIKDFQAHLDLLSVKQSFSKCLEYPTELVDSPANCAGIVTLSDFVDKASPISGLESSCKGDLGGDLVCRSCLAAGQEVNARLVPLSRNSSKCFVFISLYAAGIINTFGPEDTRTADCILGVTLSKPKSKSNSPTKNIIFAICGALIGILLVLAVVFIYMRFVKKRKESQPHRDYVKNVKARVLPNMGAKWFSIAELDEATNGFSQQNFIGQGGFGVVHKGTLEDGTVVAVKKMISFDAETDNDFVNEAEIISKIRHRNLLALRGFCATSDPVDGNERYLVYEFMPNGSLHDHIFEKKTKKGLSWPQRKSIILDVANGLSYLHNGIKPAIYHRDIKATNILLDSNMKALVADFGLAKQSGGEGQTHMTTRVAGTYGYVAPEYALYGQLTEKSDVYSFGIIVLEIMTGRKVLEEVKGGMVLIADWVWDMVRSDRIDEVYDSSMNEGTLPKSVMSRFIRVGLLCAHSMVALRPTISQALRMLEGDIDIPRLMDRPPPLGDSSRSSFHDSNGFMTWSGSEASLASSSITTRV
ncbi:protein kinase-like domain, Concanavalin A-like lectin/glucanase domain protein [Artemisia annua]|uniref:non-specific serine/threonine protein kinase n=1 Tax=Artemisia annua TaxID=35608 RepID=A0A2U1LS04_ARTAN|nr:protein kinase-like domain, Concanavalin A-like lectin/glucanase domain protein [Artemisia annua]